MTQKALQNAIQAKIGELHAHEKTLKSVIDNTNNIVEKKAHMMFSMATDPVPPLETIFQTYDPGCLPEPNARDGLTTLEETSKPWPITLGSTSKTTPARP